MRTILNCFLQAYAYGSNRFTPTGTHTPTDADFILPSVGQSRLGDTLSIRMH